MTFCLRPTPTLARRIRGPRAGRDALEPIVCAPVAAAELLTARGLPDDKAVAAFYRPDDVQSVYPTVADKDLKRMLAALPDHVEVPATLRWRGIAIENVS